MISLQVLRVGTVLASCLAIVSIQDADALRKQRRENAASRIEAARPSPGVMDAAPSQIQTVAPDRAGAPAVDTVPPVRLDKLV